MLRRGEIWLANLNPQRGTEPGKSRPVLILQAQGLLDAEHPSTVIAPLTTNLIADAEPLRIRIPAIARLRHDSDLLVDQIRAIDNRRFGDGPPATVDDALLARVGQAIREILDLTEQKNGPEVIPAVIRFPLCSEDGIYSVIRIIQSSDFLRGFLRRALSGFPGNRG